MTLLLLFQVKLVNIRNDDITDGNPKLTLGLIWTIILHFQVGHESFLLKDTGRAAGACCLPRALASGSVCACFVAMPACRSVRRINARCSVMETGVSNALFSSFT